MSGALVDLVAIGVQDTYLTGDPQTTYFRQAYKRHTNFAMEPVRQVIEGDPVGGGWSQVTITRNGDLLTDLYFLSDATGDGDINIPFDEIELYIGGQQIDKINRDEQSATAQLFRPTTSSTFLTSTTPAATAGSHSVQFFFGRGYSCALPLCALQYHDVTLRIKWPTTLVTGHHLYADYVQLDTAERNAFASKPLTMLIEQHQKNPIDAIPVSSQGYASLSMSHPVKAIYTSNVGYPDDTATLGWPLDCYMKLEFNGKDRTPLLPCENYFVEHQIGKHTEHDSSRDFPMYSFALYPNRLSPTGSCNFSRLDNARLNVETAAVGEVLAGSHVYALNWNFLKLEDGMGGLLYAN